jgi:tellurite resistance protein TehA-like permease
LFYGLFAIGILVVGNNYLLIGTHVIDPNVSLGISKTIWVAGTVVSMFTVIVVPYLLFAVHHVEVKDTSVGWLAPIVPPNVAAATGANLIPLFGSHSMQFALTAVVIAMFGITFFLFIMVSSLIYARLVYLKRLSGELTPSLWMMIGPIGMSMATFGILPLKTQAILATPYNNVLHTIGMVFCMAMWGVGIWWMIIAAMHSLFHLTRCGEGLPFNLGWWSFVFPLGSFTSGTFALEHLVNSRFFAIAGFVQLVVLWLLFIIVSTRTINGILNGSLFTRQTERRHQVSGAKMKRG